MAERKLSPAQEKFFSRYISDSLLDRLQQEAAPKPADTGPAVLDKEIRKALAECDARQPHLDAWNIPLAKTAAQEARTLAAAHSALVANGDDAARRNLLDQITRLDQRMAQALDDHKDAFRDQLDQIEGQFRSVELAFQDIDDDSFADGQAAPVQDELTNLRAAINDVEGYDLAALPALQKRVKIARTLVSDVESRSKTNSEVMDQLRKLDLIIQQNSGAKAPLLAVFEEHKLEHDALSRRWPTMLLPDVLHALDDLATRIDTDVQRSRVLLARRVN